jgi:intergrase/recombinase
MRDQIEQGLHIPEKSKTIGTRIKEDDLAALNQRFKIDGFSGLSDLLYAYLNGQVAKAGRTPQVEHLLMRLRDKKITDPLTGDITPIFYKNIDIEDFTKYLKGKYQSKYHLDLVSYFQRFADLFFTKPEIVATESGRNRASICDAMRRFADYYDYRFHNPEIKLLIQEIIERYDINNKMREHHFVWIADQNYLHNSITRILSKFDKGELAILIRFALFSGLRGEEIEYVYDRQICKNLSGCDCGNLHVVNKDNGISVIVINRILGRKRAYFTIAPTKAWCDFRGLPTADYEFRRFAHLQIKETTNGETMFMDLRKFHYNINVRSEMKELGAEVLAGRAKTVSARHYLLSELDELAEQYEKAWKKYFMI